MLGRHSCPQKGICVLSFMRGDAGGNMSAKLTDVLRGG